jgi:putative transposase
MLTIIAIRDTIPMSAGCDLANCIDTLVSSAPGFAVTSRAQGLIMRRSFKFRLYPNVNQERELAIMLETHRRLYNYCLEMRQLAWDVYRTAITFKDQRTWWAHVWRDHPYYSRLNSNSADETMKRLDLAFQAFFRRIKAGEKPGHPRFKGRDRFDAVCFGTYPNGLKLIEDRIRVQHVGSIKVKLHRMIRGKIKTASLKCEAGKWFVIFSCDLGPCLLEPSVNPEIGIDVGLASFLTTSEGEHVDNPRYLKTTLPELRVAGRALARKKRGGSNRRKSRKRVARTHVKVANQRRDHHNKVAHDLVSRFGVIAVERLDVRGLIAKSVADVKSRRLAREPIFVRPRQIVDVGWGGFLSTLRSQAESAGVAFVEVEPRGTSQTCSGCGAIVLKDLSVRTHRCPECGLVLDRDVNAARNILARARQARLGPADQERSRNGKGHGPRSSSRQPVIQAPARTRVKKRVAGGGP